MLNRILSALGAARTAWDGAASGSRTSGWAAPMLGPNRLDSNPSTLQARAADLARNNPYARRAVSAIVGAAVGASGINPQFPDRAVQTAWDRWAGNWWTPFVAQALRAVVVSGECFVILRIDPEASGVPLRLQILGPEHLDESRIGPDTASGIRYDANGRPLGYWLYPRNPRANLISAAGLQSVFISASECLHIFRPEHPGATRGQSWMNAGTHALREHDDFLGASLVRAKVSALFCGILETPDGTNPLSINGAAVSLEPGSVISLLPGQKWQQTETPDTGANLDPFVRAQLRRIAAALDVPYEILSGDSSQITFASGRHALLEWRRTNETIQYNLLVPVLCEPVMRAWEAFAAALGEIETTGNAARWIAPTIAMLDPAADTRADVERVRAGFTSRSEVIAAAGWRAEEIDSEIAADNARADALGLKLDSDGRQMTAQGQAQQGQAA